MWRVVLTLVGHNGEVTELPYLSWGDRFEATHAAITALSTYADDPEWVTLQKITISQMDKEN